MDAPEVSSLDAFRDDAREFCRLGVEVLPCTSDGCAVMALAISVMAAGSCSGGEHFQRSSGFINSYDRSTCGISIGPSMGESDADAGWETSLLLRRALANQLLICDCFKPVNCLSSSLSRSVGYGWSRCSLSQFLSDLTASRENLEPFLRPRASACDANGFICDVSGP